MKVIPSGRAFVWLGVLSLFFVLGFAQPLLPWIGLVGDAFLLMLVWRDARNAPAITVERKLADVVHQGEHVAIGATVVRHGGGPLTLRLRDPLTEALSSDPVEYDLEGAEASTTELRSTIVPRRRGEHHLPAMAARVLGPAGLGWRQTEVARAQTVKVFPRIHFDGETGRQLRRLLERRPGTRTTRLPGPATETHALREFQTGDAVRFVHWRASARRNRPLAREMAFEQDRELVVLLDAGRPMAALSEGHTKFDHALAAALALARVAVHHRDVVNIVVFSRDIRRVIRVDRRTRGFGPVFNALYDEAADSDEPDYAAATLWVRRTLERRALVVLCTSIIDATGTDRLQSTLGALGTRHRTLLVNLADPAVQRLAAAVPDDLEGAMTKATAMGALLRISELTRRLRRRRVRSVSVSAERLAGGMVEAWLSERSSN